MSFMRRLALFATAAALCAGLTGFAALEHTTNPPSPLAAPPPAADAAHTAPSIGTVVRALQDHLRLQPADADSWAQLGSAYVEQARLAVDPTLYPKAETALRRSLKVRPDANTAAQTGMAGLANARHQFAQARTWAE